jgi:hypothetical protein
MDFPIVLNSQDIIVSTKKNNTFFLLLLCFIVFFILICLISLFVVRRWKKKKKKHIGFIKIQNDGTDVYMNAFEKIFPQNEQNASIMLHTSDVPSTKWEVKYDDSNNKTFTLTTELNGITYSLQDGAPGTSAPWGIAYLAPDNENGKIGTNVQLSITSTGSIQAIISPWPSSSLLKCLSNVSGVLMWKEESSTLFVLP